MTRASPVILERAPRPLWCRRLSLMVSFLGACSPSPASTQKDPGDHLVDTSLGDSAVDTSLGDSAVDTSLGDSAVDTSPPSDPFFGESYVPPLEIPAFSAHNADGSPRSQADLLQHPTVLWFFRAAGGST